MPLAHKADESCPNCGRDVWVHEKQEATFTKLQYECDGCGDYWTERRQNGGLDK